MDEDYTLDRSSQAAEFVVMLYQGCSKKPTPEEVSQMLSVFYEHLKQDDVYFSEGEGNIITLSMSDK